MSKGTYSYEVRFTDDPLFPWTYSIYLDDKLLGKFRYLNYTNFARSERDAINRAKRYIKNHRKNKGRVVYG